MPAPISRFLRPMTGGGALLARRVPQPMAPRVRRECLPPSQYDQPFPNKLRLGYAMRVYWEIIPVVVTTAIALSFTCTAIFWALANKVDCSYMKHNQWSTISRTMDLRNPSCHKMVTINQRYEPWPEMQIVLDKMTLAEKRALVRMQTCSHP